MTSSPPPASSSPPSPKSAPHSPDMSEKKIEEQGHLNNEPTGPGQHVDAFDQHIGEKEHINYKSMGWIQAAALIMAETIALGILSFPSVFHRLGMGIGIMVTVILAAISWYTGYVLVQFKVNHPEVMNFGEAGYVIGGKYGGYLLSAMLMIKSIFVAGSHSLSGGIALDSISSHATCNVVWALVISIVCFLLTAPRTFAGVTGISFASVTAIIIAVLITIIASGVQSDSTLVPPEDSPDYQGPIEYHGVTHNELHTVISAVTNIIFAYGGHVSIFSFCAEMKNPRDFKYSLAAVQTVATVLYIIAGATIYSFSGQYVTSPALTGTSKPVHITSYAIALVSIIVAGVVPSLVAAKFCWVTFFRGSDTLTSRSYKAWSYWLAICGTIWTIAFIISQLIPFFNALLSIISSLLTVWFTYGLSGILFLHDNRPDRAENLPMAIRGGYFSSWKKGSLTVINIIIILGSCGIMGLGVYGAVQDIIDGYSEGTYKHPFSCEGSG